MVLRGDCPKGEDETSRVFSDEGKGVVSYHGEWVVWVWDCSLIALVGLDRMKA